MKYLLGTAAVAGALLVAAPARAADASMYIPSVDQLWSGAYFGVVAGGGRTDSEAVDVADYNLLGNEVITYDASGALVGGTVGFNWQSGAWVYGVEGDVAWSDIDGTGESAYGGGGDTFLSTEVNWIATIRARFGRAFADDRLLIFVTGGLLLADVENSVVDVVTGPGPDTANLSKSSTRTAFTAGLGLELALHSGWSLKGDWLYADLGEESVTGESDIGGDDIHYRFSDPLHLFRVGLNKRM